MTTTEASPAAVKRGPERGRSKYSYLFTALAAGALTLSGAHPVHDAPPPQPYEQQVDIVALEQTAALYPNTIKEAKAVIARVTRGMVNLSVQQMTADPQEVDAMKRNIHADSCLSDDSQISSYARMYNLVPQSDVAVVLTDMTRCKNPGMIGGFTAGKDIDIIGMSSMPEQEQLNVLLHELGHTFSIGHQSSVDFDETNQPHVDPLYKRTLASSHIDLTPALQAKPLQEYGLALDCDLMGSDGTYCSPTSDSLSTLQQLFLARELNRELPTMVIDLSKPVDQKDFKGEDWIGQIKLPTPFITAEHTSDSLTEQSFSTLSIVPRDTDYIAMQSRRCYELYLSNEDKKTDYKTVLLGVIPVSEARLSFSDSHRDPHEPTTVTLNHVTLTFHSDGTIDTSVKK